jgi:hypothetical protein
MSPGAWMRSNLTTQGYCLSDAERRELSLGLRFSTGTCLLLVATALALESPVMVFALSGIGVIAGFTARHPFDHLWNRLVRHAVGGPLLRPTRHDVATRSRWQPCGSRSWVGCCLRAHPWPRSFSAVCSWRRAPR